MDSNLKSITILHKATTFNTNSLRREIPIYLVLCLVFKNVCIELFVNISLITFLFTCVYCILFVQLLNKINI